MTYQRLPFARLARHLELQEESDMKILIGILMGMLRNVSLSCWSVSDR